MTERLPHHELQLLLGAYVLGGLDSADRRRLEEHLPGCVVCTTELARFAAVPGLLRLAPPSPSHAEPPVPQEPLARLIDAARARRAARRRRWMLVAAAAVVVVLCGAAGGLMLVMTGRNPGPAPTAIVSTYGQGRVVGQATFDPKAWGTEVRLTLDYKPYGTQPYTAWAVARDGHEERAASWTVPDSGQCSVTGATSIPRVELDHIEVRTADGNTVLRTR